MPKQVGSSIQKPPPGFIAQWYAGAVYLGNPTTTTSLQVDIQVPHDYPPSGDFYYVLLSVWDNNDAYDQIGFAATDGHWGLTWAALEVCAEAIFFDPDAYVLSLGKTYTFKMEISAGLVTFSAYLGLTQVWSLSHFTGGTAFVLDDEYSCGGQTYRDYTDYEEVFDLVDEFEFGSLPSYSFFFSDNKAGGVSVTDWGRFTQNVTVPMLRELWVDISGSDVTIENQWFMLTLDSQHLPTTRPTVLSVGGDVIKLHQNDECPAIGPDYCKVWLTTYLLPSGWSAAFNPPVGDLMAASSFSFTLDITIPSSAPLGTHWVGVEAYDVDDVYTRFLVKVLLVSGGGCVAAGTPILLQNGAYLAVEDLKSGDRVTGYDVWKGKLQNLKVISVISTLVAQILIINDGLLRVTPLDQPIYMKNKTFQGWLVNPKDLQLHDLLFDPRDDAWVEVTSLEYENGLFTVYEVQTTHSNTFIANGILLDAKLF